VFTKNVKQKPLKSNHFAHWDRLQDGSLGTVLALLLASAAHAQSFLASPAADPGTLPTAAGSFQWRPGQPRNYRADEMRANSLGTGFKASPFVPLDSWIYPALDRLIALGVIPSSSQIVRPWTRLECARQLAEAHANTDDIDDDNGPLLAALDTELRHETALIDGDRDLSAQTESAYARFTQIAGTPLRDGYNFGQTVVDDDGRPYGQGPNFIAGLSAHAESGPFTVYFRGEYQYASSIPAYSFSAQQTESAADGLPFGWNLRFGKAEAAQELGSPGDRVGGVVPPREQLQGFRPMAGEDAEIVQVNRREDDVVVVGFGRADPLGERIEARLVAELFARLRLTG